MTEHPTISPGDLRRLVELALQIAVFETSEGRDAVVGLLRPDLAAAVPRLSTARMDTISIVSTCARYRGGLGELADAVRFLTGDAIAVTRLHVLVAELGRSGPAGRP